jgi:hypothetical protein
LIEIPVVDELELLEGPGGIRRIAGGQDVHELLDLGVLAPQEDDEADQECQGDQPERRESGPCRELLLHGAPVRIAAQARSRLP